MAKNSRHDEVISQILTELDNEHSTYQRLHRKYHGEEDLKAKQTHGLLCDLCNRIRKSIERK